MNDSRLTLASIAVWYVAVWYALMSCIAFAAVGCDKAAASKRGRRIPEHRLYWLSVAGGWPGAWLAHRFFRHKTQKRSYQFAFRLAALANCLLLGGLLYVLM